MPKKERFDPNVGLSRLEKTLNEVYSQLGLSAPTILYVTDSTAEERFGVPGVRRTSSSDLDILIPSSGDLGVDQKLEDYLRTQLDNTGIDVTLIDPEEARAGNGYERICLPAQMR